MKKIKKRLPIPSFLRQNQSSKKPGQAPGTLLFTGEKRLENVLMHLYDYDVEHLSEHDLSEIDDSKPYLDSPSKTWINVCGLHDIEKLKEIWDYFNLHPLIQEDILNTQQRPKIEEYADHMFFVLRMMSIADDTGELKVEQVSIVLSPNSVLSFQEDDFPIYEPVLHRLRNAAPAFVNKGPIILPMPLSIPSWITI